MTNPDQPSAPPTLTLVEKLYAVHNINTLVPEKLDLAESNYSTWSYFFKGHCSNFGVLKHIEGSSTQSSTSTPPTDDWITADSIVKSWIFLTLSSTLRKRLIKANPKTAKDAWDTIEAIFQDNKRTRVVALKGELRMIQMGDQTADEYFSNIDSIVTLLNDLGSDVSQDDVVTYAINGLSDKYGSLAQIIAHKEPFPDLSTVRSMVSTEEIRIRNKSHSLSVSTNSSAPQVQLTETPHRVQDTRTNKECNNRNNNKTEVIDFAVQQQLLSLLQDQNTLLAQYGLSTISIPRTPIGFNNSGNTSSNTGQETVLPTAFNTMTLQDPANANWHMDTGASSHLNSSAHNLSTIFNSRMYPSVLVGDGKYIHVTNTDHSTLPTPYHPLHLNNVLVTPNIVKILIYVRQFVRENKCTIEFNEFGFSVKDFWTRQILLRCDSTGDLYPVTSLSYPQAFLVGEQTWHQRLGHPGSDVIMQMAVLIATSLALWRMTALKLQFIQQMSRMPFLHSLSEIVYMHQPPCFRDPRHPDHVCLLQRSLYGLKQAPRAWFQRFAAYAARVGFLHSRCDSSLFIYRQEVMATEVLERAGMLTCNPCRTPVDTDSKLAAVLSLISMNPRGPHFLLPQADHAFTLSQSSAEAEYRGVANAMAETCRLRNLLREAKLLKENVFILDPDGALMSTQEYMQKVVEDVGEDADFNSGAWVSATNYVNAFGGTVTGCLGDIDNFLKKGKLEQVVVIVKSCSPNALGDLNVTLKDLSGTGPGTIHYKVHDVGSYEKYITVGAAMILANVLVFTPKPSKHYLNITKRNVVEVFRKDTVSLA
ncbi:ribonuclease H-like domain-containing protein [Tanacetum coccineum]